VGDGGTRDDVDIFEVKTAGGRRHG
jgi:hypothetical protein